jgi:hypothetical protein
MDIQTTITQIRSALTDAFSAIDVWFDKAPDLRSYRPRSSGWTVNEILEHIGLTNHFLLILIDKGTSKALLNSRGANLEIELQNYAFQWEKLNEIGLHKSFAWVRPEHMEPKGARTSEEVRWQLKEQMRHCGATLDTLKNGQGVLFKTTMTVNELGKIDVYEYVYFLARHAQRHITQMQENEAEFNEK